MSDLDDLQAGELRRTSALWAGEFGDRYTERNARDTFSDLLFWSRVLRHIRPRSALEFGAGDGQNIAALQRLGVGNLQAVEINESAARRALRNCAPPSWCCMARSLPAGIGGEPAIIFVGDALSVAGLRPAELVLTKGFLIHVAPDNLQQMYERIYNHSTRYIALAEYYSPQPRMIPYRGQDNALWARDFAGEMLDRFPALRLIDYGFAYRRDVSPQDDVTWFLMERS